MKIIPKKSLGQNFLTDINIINKIIDIGNINEKDNILEVGDIITEINGKEIKYKMLSTEISTKIPHTNVIFTVIRNDKKILLIVKLGKLEHDFKGQKN